MKRRIKKIMRSGDIEMIHLAVTILVKNYPPEEWRNILDTTDKGMGVTINAVYFLSDYILVIYDPSITTTVRHVRRNRELERIYRFRGLYESYKIVDI